MKLKNKLKTYGIALIFLTLLSSPALSEEFGKFGIGARLYNFEVGTTNLNEADLAFDSAYPIDINLTWRFIDKFSLELSGTRFKQGIDTKKDGFSGYIGDVTQTPLFLTLRYEQQIHESDIYTYFGLGGAYFINEFDFKKRESPAQFYGANYKNVDIDNSFAFTLSVGAEYRFKEKFALCGDIKLILNKANFNIEYIDNTTDKKDVGLTSSMFGVGLKYYF